MAHSGSILSRSSFKPSQSSQGSLTSTQMRTTSTTTQGMTMHTTQVPTPTNSTTKTIVTTSVHTMASSTPLMITSTASVPMMTPSMTMANGNVPKATSSVAVTKKSTPTMTQHSFPVSTMAPSTPMMMRSTSMAQPSSITPSSFPINQSTPVVISSASYNDSTRFSNSHDDSISFCCNSIHYHGKPDPFFCCHDNPAQLTWYFTNTFFSSPNSH